MLPGPAFIPKEPCQHPSFGHTALRPAGSTRRCWSTNRSSFNDLCEIRRWGCLANFTREEGPFWLTSAGTCPCRRHDAHTRASGLPRACTHESAFCKRNSVNVRFAPKATEVLRCRELTRCANWRPEQVQQIIAIIRSPRPRRQDQTGKASTGHGAGYRRRSLG